MYKDILSIQMLFLKPYLQILEIRELMIKKLEIYPWEYLKVFKCYPQKLDSQMCLFIY